LFALWPSQYLLVDFDEFLGLPLRGAKFPRGRRTRKFPRLRVDLPKNPQQRLGV